MGLVYANRSADQLDASLEKRYDADGKVWVRAKAHGTLTADTPYKVIVNEYGYVTAALTGDVGRFYIGVPEGAGTSGTYYWMQIGGYKNDMVTASLSVSVGHALKIDGGAVADAGADYSGAAGEFAVCTTASSSSTTQDCILIPELVDATGEGLADGDTLAFGSSSDVTMTWDGTNFIMAAAADDSLWEIGDSAATQKSFDIKWYGNENSGASYLYFDASANLVYTEDIDFRFADNDEVQFGDADDVTVRWDGTDLDWLAAADDTVMMFGNGTNNFDLRWYCADADHYIAVDASASQVNFGQDDDGLTVYFHGATSGVHWKWDAANDRMEVDGGSNLFRAVASGDGGITVSADGMTADPETASEAGYIAILVNATGYQIPIYAA